MFYVIMGNLFHNSATNVERTYVFGCLLLRIFCNYNVQTIELGHEVMTLKESMELSFSLGFPSIV